MRFRIGWLAILVATLLLALSAPAVAVAADTSPTPEPTVTIAPDTTLTVLAVGDLMVHKGQLKSARSGGAYRFGPSFGPVAGRISAADVAVGNLETTLRSGGYSGYPSFRSPTAFARALKDAGFDVLTTANNHTLDGGASGVRYTTKYLDRLGIAHTGSNKAGPAIVEHDGVRIAFLAYTYGTNGIRSPFAGAVNRINLSAMRRAIAAAREQADLVFVVPHFGSEYVRTPEHKTKDTARALIDAGADLVLGSHPHVVRPVEKYHGRYIVYSMGNFISGMSKRYTDLGIMVEATITRTSGVTAVAGLKVLPVYRDQTSGAGTAAWRTVVISDALQPGASRISASDRARMRAYRAYCADVFRGYL